MTLAGPITRRRLALGLVSAALLADQFVLMQLLATSQWHHFAYLVISVALLGFGAAGSLLAILRRPLLARQAALLPLLLCGCALAMVGPLGAAQGLFGGFDSYLVFVAASEAFKLVAVALLLMLPFAAGALAIGLIFTAETAQIGGHYGANLLGSGFGCMLGLIGLELVPPEHLPALCALLPLGAAALLLPATSRRLTSVVVLSLLVVSVQLWNPPSLNLSQYKDLRRTLQLPEAHISAYRPSAAGQIHVVGSPVLRQAPALSLNWRGPVPVRPAVFVNGNLYGYLPPAADENALLLATTAALPYVLAAPERVLVLAAGTGTEVSRALAGGADQVTAVEAHRDLVELLRHSQPDFAQMLAITGVDWRSLSGRTWLAGDDRRYDLVVLPEIGSVGGDTGLFALHEQSLLTREAMLEAWQHLTPEGLMAITVWVDYPVRRPLRLLTTLLAALEQAGVADPRSRLAALRGWGTITFAVKRTPLTATEISAVHSFADRWGFDPLLLPGISAQDRQSHHRLQDDSLLQLVDRALSPEVTDLVAAYPFRITPPEDDQPFFSQFLRWRHLDELVRHYGQRTVPFLEIGLLVAVLAAFTLTVLALVLILAPLLTLPRSLGNRTRVLVYFGGLGLGYIWVELALVHRLTLYLDHPVPAAALVICVLLVGSGVGSLLSGRCSPNRPGRWAGVVATGLVVLILLQESLLTATQHWDSSLRTLLATGLVTPLALLMGFPFPLGLRRLDQVTPAQVPWAWGINGCLSVVGAAVATLVAVELGFTLLLLLAAAVYLLPAMARIDGSGEGHQ